MTNKSQGADNPDKDYFSVADRDDYFYSKKRGKPTPAFRRGMQISNLQLKLLLPVVQQEIMKNPDNVEWRDLYERLIKQVGWRMSKPGGEELQDLLKEDFRPPPIPIWGRDYE